MDAAVAHAAAHPQDHQAHQAHPATLVTLLSESVLAVQATHTTHGAHPAHQATLATSAFRLPCHSVVAATHAVQVQAAAQAHPAFQGLLIVPVQLSVHLTNILYPAGSTILGLVIVRLLYCISLVSVVVPAQDSVTSQSLQSHHRSWSKDGSKSIVLLPSTPLALVSLNENLSSLLGTIVVILLGFIVALVGTSVAQLQPVAVLASVSACVLISTLPATVVLAFDTDPVALSTQAPPI